MRKIIFSACVVTSRLCAELVGIIGGDYPTGGGNSASFGAYVDYSNSNFLIMPVGTGSNALPVNGAIYRVSVNALNVGLVGGVSLNGSIADGFAAYIYHQAGNSIFTLPNGAGAIPNGTPGHSAFIFGVAINLNSVGIVGGNVGNNAFGAYVYPDGTVNSFSGLPTTGSIISTDINDSNLGLIGGTGGFNAQSPYAAFVTQPANVQVINNLPAIGGINEVALNANNLGLIGGTQNSFSSGYAAFVDTSGNVTPLLLPPMVGNNSRILSVSLNSSDLGLIGGQFTSTPSIAPYAAYVHPSGVVEQISLPAVGFINDVMINSTGVGLIGGQINHAAGPGYAAFVHPGNSTPQSIAGIPNGVTIYGVAINDAGVGIIGGEGSKMYAAFIAPDGTLTPFPNDAMHMPTASGGQVYSVALSNIFITPVAVVPFHAAAESVLSASYALESYLTINRPGPYAPFWNERCCECAGKGRGYNVWVMPYNDYLHQSQYRSIPTIDQNSTGALLAIDKVYPNSYLGVGVGYNFTYAAYGENLGHTKIDEELLFVYNSWRFDTWFVNGVLWGGLYQLNDLRRTSGFVNSQGNTNGQLLSPHLEVSKLLKSSVDQWFFVEGVAMVDWVNAWQDGYTESGKSGFNLVMPALYSSLLRSEAGCRFYETLCWSWGELLFEEKFSYVNQASFGTTEVTTNFIGGSLSPFKVAVGSNQDQSLGCVGFKCSLTPCKTGFYGFIDFQGEFSTGYQNYFTGVELGYRF